MGRRLLLLIMSCVAGLTGCVVVDLGVTNPIPELTTVAVVPFFNLSPERAVDGRRCALAYFSELQKVPGFEVLPVGVAEMQVVQHKLQMNDPADVLKLAELLDVDAVVVGAITDYDPYYPPRIGWHVRWYSPRQWEFYPGIQTESGARHRLREWDQERLNQWRQQEKQKDDERAPDSPFWLRGWRMFRRIPGVRKIYREPMMVRHGASELLFVRGQSPVSPLHPQSHTRPDPSVTGGSLIRDPNLVRDANLRAVPGTQTQIVPTKAASTRADRPLSAEGANRTSLQKLTPLPPEPSPPPVPPKVIPPPPPVVPPKQLPDGSSVQDWRPPEDTAADSWSAQPGNAAPGIVPPGNWAPADLPQPNPYNQPKSPELWQLDPQQPLMSYTRMFDGADGDLVASLRDYVELSGDLRSGGWEGYLHRSEDFIRFTAHLMIVEMLTLHGGEGRRRIVLKHRNLK